MKTEYINILNKWTLLRYNRHLQLTCLRKWMKIISIDQLFKIQIFFFDFFFDAKKQRNRRLTFHISQLRQSFSTAGCQSYKTQNLKNYIKAVFIVLTNKLVWIYKNINKCLLLNNYINFFKFLYNCVQKPYSRRTTAEQEVLALIVPLGKLDRLGEEANCYALTWKNLLLLPNGLAYRVGQ